MTLIELIATLFGLACVWLYVRQNIWAWPTGLVQVVLYVWVFYHARLYSDVLLHLIYVVLQLYGWYHWRRGTGDHAQPETHRLARLHAVGWMLLAAVMVGATGWLMTRFTDADLPYWDAAIMVLSLIAQFLLARRVLENWLVWVAVDVLAIGVYFAKKLYITSGLYAVFLVLAVMGWFEWRRSFPNKQQGAATLNDPGAGSSSASSFPRTAATSSSSTSPAPIAGT